ncbi:spliceosomal zinc finger-containing protein [Coprinopsis cinerea okayama7|uniref:Pre-mRNA-splicing factor CWC24 n=1 Tax=Coprinopsis cinerea (strain Okayama-7 / 130 / ATCC MYA-4618 / FGSC 9003) TaxID=240176 RepID=A8N793_COPC7|nr:spliceosomal zinc finger-containing protein [Coprinopsis cinerea okayama7\|eukprot:XP_001830699.1 spliceosomal zinc finger-containing protein [Coprinopsis cinerea okayama7\
MASTGETVNVPFFKKKKGTRPTTARKRSVSPERPDNLGASSSKTQVVLPTKKAASNLLSAGTKRTAAQRDDLDTPEKDGPDVKWSAEGSHINTALEILAGDEADEILAKRRRKERQEAGEDDIEVPDDGQYRGQNAYRTHIKKTTETPKAMRTGPQRSTNTIRTVTIVDYQPDVCKDYKETGFCGFGDTCKFLHDRGTYLAGWQLDKLAENPKKQVDDDSDSDSSDDEDIPFACLICRKPYTDPIVTRCGHYFCSACAIKRFAKTPKCLACGAPTGGIFNRADKVIDKMNKKRKEKEEKEREDDSDSNIQIEGLEEKQGSDGDKDDSDDDSE